MTASQRVLLLIVIVGAAAAGIWRWEQHQPRQKQEIRTPHFLDSTPAQAEAYAAQPINITLNFDFDLAAGSDITVRSADGREWSDGAPIIEDARTALKISLQPGMPDGQYHVRYTACWPDQACDKGEFFFSIDSSRRSEYQDLRGQSDVTVHMSDFAFQESRILISPGTTVTWANDEAAGHFVNTETHPEHTYFSAQNSREIKQGESFAVTFTIPGQYNYHCSAHVPQGMLGSIIVVR